MMSLRTSWVPVHLGVARIARATVNLHRLVQHKRCCRSGFENRCGRQFVNFAASTRALFQTLAHCRGAKGQSSGHLDFCVHVGQHRLNHLKMGDWLSELLARLGIVDGNFQRAAGNTHRGETNNCALQIKAAHGDGNTAIGQAHHVFRGDTALIKNQLAGR